MAKFYERIRECHQNLRLTNYAYDYLWKQMETGRRYYIIPSDDNTAMVVAASDNHHQIVDLEAHTCTCLEFQNLSIPC